MGQSFATFQRQQEARMKGGVLEMKLEGRQGPGQDFGLYSEENGKSLEGFEQESGIIWLT